MRWLYLRRRRSILILVVIGLAAAGLLTAARTLQRPRWNIVLVTLDTTRADHIGCYGAERALTPALDELANRGVLFERAFTTAPLTLPAHASLFTGLYPPEHGIHINGKNRLNDEITTLAEACRARGYETGGFVASFVLDEKFGLKRGFQTYDDDMTGTAPADEALHRYREGNRVVDAALNWLKGRAKQPFFCWVHLYDPHAPYLDHRELFGDQFQDRPYDAEIAFVDLQVGRLMEFLRTEQLEQRTLFVVVGDHGEGLGEHQERRHSQMLYNSTLHVPWIISWPGQLPAGRRIAAPVSLVDFFPTLAESLGLSRSAQNSGRSLLAAARGAPLAPRPLYAETDEPWFELECSQLKAVISDEWKYIRTPQVELYDLLNDPRETSNLAVKLPEQVEHFERQLSDLESGMRRRTSSAVQLSSAEQRKLTGLGYVGHAGAADAHPARGNLPDIKDRIEAANRLEDARSLLDAGQFEEAAKQLQSLVNAVPDFELAELTLGDVYLQQRKLDEAWSIYHRVFERNPESALAVTHLGDVREAQGRVPEALEYYQRALTWEPDSPKLHYNIGRALVLLQRDEEAIAHFRTAIELDPGFVFAHIEYGSALSRRGLYESALAEYEQALRYDARSVFAHMNAAMVNARLNRPRKTLSHLEQAAQITPEDAEIQYRLGLFLAQQRNFDQAKKHLQQTLQLQPDHAAAQKLIDELPSQEQ